MIHSEKGSLLIVVIIAIVVISALGVGIATMVTTGVRSSTDHSLSIQALYLAESGFEWAGNELRDKYKSNTAWSTACEELENISFPITANGFFEVYHTKFTAPANCTITVLGWIGQHKKDNIASRILKGTLSEEAITQNLASEKNIFSNSSKWNPNKHVNFYSNGSIEFTKKNKNDKLNRSNITLPLVVDGSFNKNDDIYLSLRLSDNDLQNLVEFCIEQLPESSDSNKKVTVCWDHNDLDTQAETFGEYNSVLHLGSNYTPETFNQSSLKFNITWDSNSIIILAGCIGTKTSCAVNLNNPVDPPTWQEGTN